MAELLQIFALFFSPNLDNFVLAFWILVALLSFYSWIFPRSCQPPLTVARVLPKVAPAFQKPRGFSS